MKRITTLFLIALRAQLSFCQSITISVHEAAVTPTAPGQIGVNPVTDIGPELYNNIGMISQYYQGDGTVTKFIGVDTQYLTQEPYTTTISGTPIVSTASAAIVAVTATADTNGLQAGDITIAFSPKLYDALSNLLSEVEKECGASRKRLSCEINERFAQRIVEEIRPGGQLEMVDLATMSNLPLVDAAVIQSVIAKVVFTTRVVAPAVGLFLLWEEVNKSGTRPKAFTMPKAIAKPNTPTNTEPNGDDKDKCPVNDQGNNAPFCTDNECKGDNSKTGQKCTAGKYKNCNCLNTADVVGMYDGDTNTYDYGMQWMDLQQKIFADLSSVQPTCSAKQDKGFDYKSGFDCIAHFCGKPDRKLKKRPSGDDFPDAQIDYCNATMDPSIRVYAYIENTCPDTEIMMSKEDCLNALDSVLNDCDKDSDHKAGGSAMTNCQWFNIAAIDGPYSFPGHTDPHPLPPPPPPPAPAPPAKTPTKAVSIALLMDNDDKKEVSRYSLTFSATDFGKQISPCMVDNPHWFTNIRFNELTDGVFDINKPGYPPATKNYDLSMNSKELLGEQVCFYYSGGDKNAGKFMCKGWSAPVDCHDDAEKNTSKTYRCRDIENRDVTYHRLVSCNW